MPSRVLTLSFSCMILAAAPLRAAVTEIEHKAVACIVAGKYPKLRACFGTPVSEPRTYFHAEGVHEWFYVRMAAERRDPAMAAEEVCYSGVLLRPSRKLINKHVWYYIQFVDKDQQTAEHDPLVVRRALDCKKDAPVAPISPTGPTAVFPSLSVPGFTAGSFPAAAVGATVVGGGAVALALTQKGGETTPPGAPPPPPPPPPPITPVTSPPATTPPSPLAVSCSATPNSGQAPLTVVFSAFASGATGSYDFAWQFGDGGTSTQVHPTHTYTSPGTYTAMLTVTSGDQVRPCEKNITVTPPPTPPPPPSAKTLTLTAVQIEGCSPGPTVQITPPTPPSDCESSLFPGTKCTETYSVGTSVKLTAIPLPGCYDVVCWDGDCLGTSTKPGSVCTLTMSTDKVASATFVFGSCIGSAEPPVSLAWDIDLDVPGAVGQAVVDGQAVVTDSGQRAQRTARKRDGEAVVVAQLIKAGGKPGTWRFEAQPADALEPGSLRVLRGEVELVTPTSVVFRLRGQVGEQVAFSYRLRR